MEFFEKALCFKQRKFHVSNIETIDFQAFKQTIKEMINMILLSLLHWFQGEDSLSFIQMLILAKSEQGVLDLSAGKWR